MSWRAGPMVRKANCLLSGSTEEAKNQDWERKTEINVEENCRRGEIHRGSLK